MELLTKKEKLTVIDKIISWYEYDNTYQHFLCIDLREVAHCYGYYDKKETSNVLDLFPELIEVRPEKEEYTKYPEHASWFGDVTDKKNCSARLQALQQLRKIIKNDNNKQNELWEQEN